MIIREIEFENYRGFEHEKFNFNPRFNVIIADNAMGKTSILEGIAASLGGFLSGIQYKSRKSIQNKDIRIIQYGSNPRISDYAALKIVAEIFKNRYEWHRERHYNKRLNDIHLYENVFNLGKELRESVDQGRFTTLPVVSYYGTGRLLKDNEIALHSEKELKRFDGYTKSLNPNSNYRTLINWFRTNEISLYKSGKKIGIVNSMKKAISSSFEEIETIYYDNDNDVLAVQLNINGIINSLPIHNLSDGQRNLIGLIGDIALRCNLLNPRFGEKAHLMTPGIVLIDEVGQHLHPNWQKKIVDILKSTFPKIQFIITTHSPFVIQSLRNKELLDLNVKELDTDYFVKSIDEIAIEEMGVNSGRSERFNKMEDIAIKFYQAVSKEKNSKNDNEIQKLKKKLEEIELEFNEDPTYVALIKAEFNRL